MKHHRKSVDEILRTEVPLADADQVESAGERVLYRLHHRREYVGEESFEDLVPQRPQWGSKRLLPAVAAMALIAVAVVIFFPDSSPVPPHDGAAFGEYIRTESLSGKIVELRDGSRIELRSSSEMILHAAHRDTRIRLNRGSIIVRAAKQRTGHFHVQTSDLTVSVTGTVFLVSAGRSGSTVGVVEGEVLVRRGDSEMPVHPGEQISSASFSKDKLLPETLAWSRESTALAALLPRGSRRPPSAPAQQPSFEVASIRPSTKTSSGGSLAPRGDRFIADNLPLWSLLNYAYHPPGATQFLRSQIIGAPIWADTDRFNIDAKVGADTRSLPVEQLRGMVQSLLMDRFKLKARRETRELPVYDLILTKGGPKLSADQTPPDPGMRFIYFADEGEPLRDLPRGAIRQVQGPSRVVLTGNAVSVSRVMSLLQGKTDRIIIDKTNFMGLIDIHLEFSQDTGALPPDGPLPPSLFSALPEIGFKLEPSKALLPVVIIDSVEKPSEN